MDTLQVPSKFTEPEASPSKLIFLVVCNPVAVVAFPLREPINVLDVIKFAPVNSPVSVAPFIVGIVSVLFVNVSSVVRPTRVSVSVGNEIVPIFKIELIVGVVNVLFVNV